MGIFPYLKPAADLIHANNKLGGNSLVHCHWGKSRSVSLCIAYLLLYEKSKSSTEKCMTVDEALAIIQKNRPFAKPDRNFISQLKKFYSVHLQNIDSKASNT